MSNETAILEKLVTEATLLLQETESSLQQLAQAALAEHEQLLTNQQQNGHNSAEREAADRLQRIGQQLSRFSEHSRLLQLYLQNGLESAPAYDNHWSRIRILQSQEEERSLLARDLENSVGQLLANAVFELASCRRLSAHDDTQALSEGLDALQQELEQGLADIRRFITDLEPAAILNNFGLGGGVRRYLEQYEARTRIKAELRIKTNLGRLPNIVEIAIFRVIQESLLNVERHAQAGRVEVVFEEKDHMIEFSVIDDGIGFASDRIDMSKKNLGLARMVDYAALLGGKLRIFSEPDHGTQVVLLVPYQAL